MQVYCSNCSAQVDARMCDAPNDCEDSKNPNHAHCGSCGVTVDPGEAEQEEDKQ